MMIMKIMMTMVTKMTMTIISGRVMTMTIISSRVMQGMRKPDQ